MQALHEAVQSLLEALLQRSVVSRADIDLHTLDCPFLATTASIGKLDPTKEPTYVCLLLRSPQYDAPLCKIRWEKKPLEP